MNERHDRIFVGFAEFATGAKFRIEKEQKGQYVVIDERTNQESRRGSYANAWDNIRHQANVSPKTGHTEGVQWAPSSDLEKMGLPRREQADKLDLRRAA